MDNLKHVGWLYRLRGKADTTLVLKNKANNFEQFNTKWQKSDAVYTIPDTHRVVPVEFIQVLQDAPEINPSNYDHDQVCRLNTAVCEALAMLAATKEKRS